MLFECRCNGTWLTTPNCSLQTSLAFPWHRFSRQCFLFWSFILPEVSEQRLQALRKRAPAIRSKDVTYRVCRYWSDISSVVFPVSSLLIKWQFKAVIKFWFTYSLVLRAHSKLVTLWVNSIKAISPIASRGYRTYTQWYSNWCWPRPLITALRDSLFVLQDMIHVHVIYFKNMIKSLLIIIGIISY